MPHHARLERGAIGELFLAACRAELDALKPGNVHVHAAGHGMEVAQFEASAVAAAPFLARGRRWRRRSASCGAVEASFAAAGCNTNLGILLLCAPLAAAAELPGDATSARRLRVVLNGFDDDDAAAVFAAIRLASPGGLGAVPEQDVADGTDRRATRGDGARRRARSHRRGVRHRLCRHLRVRACRCSPTPRRTRTIRGSPSPRCTWRIWPIFRTVTLRASTGRQWRERVREKANALAPAWQPVARRNTLPELLDFDAELKRAQR